MTQLIDMVLDLQYGSTGKGLIAGYLAFTRDYDTVACAFATNAGHTYINKEADLYVMTQQLPTAAVVSPTVKNVLIGPGALIHEETLEAELAKYAKHLVGKRVMIHPQAAVVTDAHASKEKSNGYTRIGSTTKGVGEAMVERIQRRPTTHNTARNFFINGVLSDLVVTEVEYRAAIEASQNILIEGAQGFGLSMYHGAYPYTTSRDVTPWQLLADIGAPFKWASKVRVIGTARTYPIRVNNRDGTSGPCYPDQREIQWSDIGVEPELTTVTRLARRIFTFSQTQIDEALFHCGGYWDTQIFLNFANYCELSHLEKIITNIERPRAECLNPPKVVWLGYGPDHLNVKQRGE
jgi:adenylosuccinate synthase